jgi:hypothetical protein
MNSTLAIVLDRIHKMTDPDDLFTVREALLKRLDEIGAYGEDDDDFDLPETDEDLDDMLDDEDE